MAKVLKGMILTALNPRIKRGEITFSEMTFQPDGGGKVIAWKNMSMEREVADVLRIQQPVTLYLSPLFDSLFGVRTHDGVGVFKAGSANLLFLLMSIGMIFLGLGTSMFLFPLLIALAGIAGVVLSLQARSARSKFRRDHKASARPAA